MSYDLFLLRLKADDDIAAALQSLESIDSVSSATEGLDVRSAADVLERIEPRYRRFSLDYAEIARFENISINDAKSRYNYVELDGPPDSAMAQFIFHPHHVDVHWYSGTSEEEMLVYLKALCAHAGLSVVDPQSNKILRLDVSGNLR
jgi:hypothetical protein